MSRITSVTMLAALASVSLGGGCAGTAMRPQTLSPANMYRLCSDVRFQCTPRDRQTVPAPIQIDTNLAAPPNHSNLG